MLIYNFVNFLFYYGLDAVICALIVALISSLITKFLTQKQKLYVKMLTPFILGIIVYFLYNVIVYNIIDFNENTVLAGILTGSLSSAIFAFLNRIIKGKTEDTDGKTLVLEGIVNGFVKKEFITETVKNIISEIDKCQEKEKTLSAICSILKPVAVEGMKNDDIEILSNLCFESVKNLNL